MRILGCIREIQLTELVVSLPNSLNGYVPITSVHDVLTEQLQKSFNQNGDEDDEVILLSGVNLCFFKLSKSVTYIFFYKK